MTIRAELHTKLLLFLFPLFLYEDFLLSVALLIIGLFICYSERLYTILTRLNWKEYLFFVYMFHMLFGERNFAYVGIEPLFITEIVLGILIIGYSKDLIRVRRVLLIYYLIVLIGIGFAFIYFFQYKLDAIRDSFMLIYAIWVPIVYHVFRQKKHYELFYLLLKIFIVLKATAYIYEVTMIFMGFKSITFEGFRFGVGYVVPSLIVISLFVPVKELDWKYKILSLMMIPAVFTLFHRSIFLGIALGVLVIFILGSREIRSNILKYGAFSLVLLIGFLIAYNAYIDVDLFSILERKTSFDEGNINYRLLSWQHVMDKFSDFFLIGYGVGKPIMYIHQNIFYTTIDLSYFQIRDLAGNAQPHNSYLNILARFGVLIFPLFLYAILKPLFRILRVLDRDSLKSSYIDYHLLLLTGFLMLMYVFTFFNVVLEGPHHSFAFWLIVGMVLSFGRSRMFDPKLIRIRTNYLQPSEDSSSS